MYALAIAFEESLFEFTTSSTFSGPPPACIGLAIARTAKMAAMAD
jgi:hypothetical protein